MVLRYHFTQSFFVFVVVVVVVGGGLHWIKKRSSRGNLLEYLQSSGAKPMMRGHKVCIGKKQILEKNFIVSSHFTVALPCYLSEGFKASGSWGGIIVAEPPFWS